MGPSGVMRCACQCWLWHNSIVRPIDCCRLCAIARLRHPARLYVDSETHGKPTQWPDTISCGLDCSNDFWLGLLYRHYWNPSHLWGLPDGSNMSASGGIRHKAHREN